MDIVVILVAALLVGGIGWLVNRKLRRDEAEFERRYAFDEDGIQRLGDQEHNKPVQFQGEGAQTTSSVKLEAGDYRIRYLFPENALVKVELFSTEDGEGELIILKSGAGESGFSIDVGGRYRFDVEPQEGAAWKLEINRLGLPSGYKPSPL